MKTQLIIVAGLLLFSLLGSSCAPAKSLDASLGVVVQSYRFSLIGWELQALSYELEQWIFGGSKEAGDEIDVVIEYFATVERMKVLGSEIEALKTGNGQGDLASLEVELDLLQEENEALETKVERIIEKQIRETLKQLGIFSPIDDLIRWEINFPPVNFRLAQPPHLLVISPRDRIESLREITLRQDISIEEIENIEAAALELGVSSLVVKLGGVATYPAFVTNDASLQFTINAAIEEWLHQYLFFRPLGFLYALDLIGISRNYEIATMNETLASMVSNEIGSILYKNYYSSQYEEEDTQTKANGSEFDFNREMREIRKAVDEYLAQGEIEQAEEFMEQKRQFLASKGYYIRELNQAYFAFYGAYADSPTSVSPIGSELKTLRGQSASLEDFLDTVAQMTSHQGLINSIK